MDRYAHPSNNGDKDLAVLICHDCSTRTRVVTIPADERDTHDQWHDVLTDAGRSAVAVMVARGRSVADAIRHVQGGPRIVTR